jgi:hypothetical protein
MHRQISGIRKTTNTLPVQSRRIEKTKQLDRKNEKPSTPDESFNKHDGLGETNALKLG